MANDYYIGLMSGTSLDAVDTVLMDFSTSPTLIASHETPLNEALRQDILKLCHTGNNAIHRLGTIDVTLGRLFAECVNALLKKTSISPSSIKAIGSHGQTIRHHPHSNHPYTLQIGDPNIIAANTGITTVADFRRRDMALGGQAAPLAPIFHQHLFAHTQADQWVINIGGMANVTYIPADASKTVIGYDTGPGNVLMDAWYQQHHANPYDQDGRWAAQGNCDLTLLNALLADPYFQKPPPKSTGREYFNLAWLQSKLTSQPYLKPEDIQATLLTLTVRSILDSIQTNTHQKETMLWLCGGGSHNTSLVQQLNTSSSNLHIRKTDEIGISADWMEAAAFAWMAKQTLTGLPCNLPSVTGAHTESILGAIYLK